MDDVAARSFAAHTPGCQYFTASTTEARRAPAWRATTREHKAPVQIPRASMLSREASPRCEPRGELARGRQPREGVRARGCEHAMVRARGCEHAGASTRVRARDGACTRMRARG